MTTDQIPSTPDTWLWVLSFNEADKQWHYQPHHRTPWPEAHDWVTISRPCPEYQLRLFTCFMDFTPQRKQVRGATMKKEWIRFKLWLHWLEACGIDCQAIKLPNYELLPETFAKIREQSRGADD